MFNAILKRLTKTHNSLSFKLAVAVSSGVLFACILVMIGVLIRTADRQQEGRAKEMKTYANVLAAGVSNAMFIGDETEVTRTLNAIATARGIEFAAAYDLEGNRVAVIGMQAVLLDSELRDATIKAPFSSLFKTQTITAQTPIRKNGRNIGTLRIAGERSSVGAAFMAELKIALIWAVLAICIGIIVALLFQRRIVRPLEQLTGTITKAGHIDALPAKFSYSEKGEIGVLVGAYNGMIDEIAMREAQLTDYKLHLEDLVDVRTKELRSARDEAQTATQVKSRFLATMSHEIRTPMNGLLVMAELLERSNLQDTEKRYASTIARSGRSLMHLLNEIMDFSKLEAGKIQIESIEMNIDDLLNDCVSIFWDQARSKNIELTSYVAPDVPALSLGDPTRIKQCISNLVGNAIKFTDRGYVAISASIDASHVLHVAVTDTGIGIPQDRASTIFEAFSQADQSTTRRHEGTGLGLNICAQLAAAMGGSVEVESTVGEGSCFILHLPIQAVEAYQPMSDLPECVVIDTEHPTLKLYVETALIARGIETSGNPEAIFVDVNDTRKPTSDVPRIGLWSFDQPLPENAIRQGWLDDLLRLPIERSDFDALLERVARKRLRGVEILRQTTSDGAHTDHHSYEGLSILLADDSAVNREVMLEALAPYGLEPTVVEDGRAALQALLTRPFDIAFIDGEMPNLDGFEVAKRARGKGVEAKLILFSAHARASTAGRAEESGFDGQLSKPFSLESLEKVLSATEKAQWQSCEKLAVENAEGQIALLEEETLEALRGLDVRRPGAMRRVIDRFMSTLPDAMLRMEKTIASKDIEAVRQEAHSLKSMCLSVGASKMSVLAGSLEALSASGGIPQDDREQQIAAIGATLKDAAQKTVLALSEVKVIRDQDEAKLIADHSI